MWQRACLPRSEWVQVDEGVDRGIMIMNTRDTVWMNRQPEHKTFESMRQNTKEGNAS